MHISDAVKKSENGPGVGELFGGEARGEKFHVNIKGDGGPEASRRVQKRLTMPHMVSIGWEC